MIVSHSSLAFILLFSRLRPILIVLVMAELRDSITKIPLSTY